MKDGGSEVNVQNQVSQPIHTRVTVCLFPHDSLDVNVEFNEVNRVEVCQSHKMFFFSIHLWNLYARSS